MATKHTQGPWAITNDDGAVCMVQGADGTVIARVLCGNSLDDARLIAAAPELLAALESFLRAPSVGSNGPGSSTIVVQEFNLRAARAAIAKATGSAS